METKPILRSCIFIVILMVASSCVDKIDIQAPAGLSDSIVILGRAVLDENKSYVEVSAKRLFDFTGESRLNLNLQKVVLKDELGFEVELSSNGVQEYYAEIGKYSDLQLELDKGYYLEVTTFDHRTYRSDIDILSPNTGVIDSKFDVNKEERIDVVGDRTEVSKLQLSITFDIGNDNHGFLWEPMSTFRITDRLHDGSQTCYISNNINVGAIPSIRVDENSNRQFSNFPLTSISINSKMAEGMYINVDQYSLSEGAAEFWNNASQLVEKTGDNIFDTTVGEVRSNFKNIEDDTEKVYGYFYTSQLKKYHVKVPTNLVSDSLIFCHDPMNTMRGVPCVGICCDCLTAPLSTTSKPNYWID